MSRSKRTGCVPLCGMCNAHKRWKTNSINNERPSVQRTMQDDPIRDEDLDITREEMAALPETCRKECCTPPKIQCLEVGAAFMNGAEFTAEVPPWAVEQLKGVPIALGIGLSRTGARLVLEDGRRIELAPTQHESGGDP